MGTVDDPTGLTMLGDETLDTAAKRLMKYSIAQTVWLKFKCLTFSRLLLTKMSTARGEGGCRRKPTPRGKEIDT